MKNFILGFLVAAMLAAGGAWLFLRKLVSAGARTGCTGAEVPLPHAPLLRF